MSRNLSLSMLLAFGLAAAEPLGTGFTYQGELEVNDAPADGSFDFQFELFDALAGGGSVAGPVSVDDIQVTDGVFTAELDFGTGPFAGDQLWLQIGVRDGADSDPHQLLNPRQKLSATPYALHAEMVAMDAIGGAEIANNSVAAADIAANAVGASELANNAVDSAAIVNGAITAADLGRGSVNSSAILDGSVSGIDLARESVSSGHLAANSVGTSEIISSQVQRRVGGTCGDGTYLSGISESGGVICASLPVGLRQRLGLIAAGNSPISVAVRSDDRAILGFTDPMGNLTIYACADVNCTSGTAQDTGLFSTVFSIAVRSDDRAIVSSSSGQFNGTEDLEVYDCADSNCSSGTARVLDSAGVVGLDNSIAVRSDDRAIISYRDATLGHLKLFDCADAGCTSGTIRTLDASGTVGDRGTSIAIRSDDRALISYRDTGSTRLKIYDCADPGCASGSDHESYGGGSHSSIAMRSNDLAVISHVTNSNSLNLIDCQNAGCTSALIRYFTAAGSRGTSIAMRPDDRALAAYGNDDNALELFNCNITSCDSGYARAVEFAAFAAISKSVAVRSDGRPIIAYATGGVVTVYSCGDTECYN